MSKIGNYNILKVFDFWLEDKTTGLLRAYSDQPQSLNIETPATKKEFTDRDGNVYYTDYDGKKGTLAVTMSMFNFDIEALVAGDSVHTSGLSNIPKVVRVAATTTSVDAADAVSGSIHVDELTSTGVLVKTLTLDSTTGTGKFTFADGKIGLPTSSASNIYIIRYKRNITSGDYQGYSNLSNKFPKEVAGGARVLILDPCDGIKVKYFEFPRVKPSAESVSLNMSNDENQTYDFNADLLTDYCAGEKRLYSSYFVDGDEEDEDFDNNDTSGDEGE